MIGALHVHSPHSVTVSCYGQARHALLCRTLCKPMQCNLASLPKCSALPGCLRCRHTPDTPEYAKATLHCIQYSSPAVPRRSRATAACRPAHNFTLFVTAKALAKRSASTTPCRFFEFATAKSSSPASRLSMVSLTKSGSVMPMLRPCAPM